MFNFRGPMEKVASQLAGILLTNFEGLSTTNVNNRASLIYFFIHLHGFVKFIIKFKKNSFNVRSVRFQNDESYIYFGELNDAPRYLNTFAFHSTNILLCTL